MSPTLRAMMLAAAAGAAKADWYHGAPECAQSCLSSAYSDPTITSGASWPAATAYCVDDGPDAGSCISDACKDGDDKSAVSSYSAMSASICQGYSSCVDAGNTGVQTFSYGGGPVTWAAPGGWAANVNPTGASQTVVDAYNSAVGNSTGSAAEDAAATATASGAPLGFGGAKGPGDNNREQWSEWASVYSGSATWSGGAVTATGCAGFGGSPWYVGPGCGWNDKGGFDGWMGWGEGWEWIESSTVETVTYTTTDAEGSAETTVGPQTLAVAVSDGTYTLTSTLAQAQETGGSDSDGSDGDSGSDDQEGAAAGRLVPAAGGDGNIVTGMVGLALGAMVVMVGLL